MPGSSSWMPYAPQGVKGFDDDDDDDDDIAEEVGGAGDEGSGDTTAVDIQTLLEGFFNMSLRVGTVFLKC